MASVASERIPIATLHPSLPVPATKSITALVTILWPYSSSARTCALLLAEPDFRLRRRRGQVRVQFFGDAAYAVATSQLGIGDRVVLKLGGVQWLQSSGEEEVVRTPGKSVDWELGFRDRLAMLVTRDRKQFANIEVERSTPEPPEEEPEEEAVYNTPSKIVGRFSAEGLRFNTWSSPAFLKHGRLSGESISDYDLFADEDESKSRKRRRTSFKNIGVWTYAARTPSPEKGDAISPDEDALVSPSERANASAPPPQALDLPETPISARTTPAEVPVDQEEDLVAEPSREKDAEAIDGRSRVSQMPPRDLQEEAKDQDDALYEQFLEEVHEDQESDTEVEEYPDEPEDAPAALYSIQDARVIRGDSEPESLPSVIPDTDVAVPSAAASVRVDESTGNTEQDSAVEDELEMVELSSTEADSEVGLEPGVPQYSEVEVQQAQSSAKPTTRLHLSSPEEDDSEDEKTSIASFSWRQGVQDEGRTASHKAPEASPIQTESVTAGHENIHEAPEALLGRGPEDANEGRAEVGGVAETLDSQPAKITSQDAKGRATPTLEGPTAGTIMPPPVIPQLHTDTGITRSPAKTPPMGPVNAPSTPQLQPVTSATLPLPSPFPVSAGATSYMDARPTVSEQQASISVTSGQEQHDIRPATAMSVAQAAQEALRNPQKSIESGLDPAPQMAEPVASLGADDSGREKLSTEFQFGLDGSALSAARESRSAEARKVLEIVDLQDTQLYESASVSPAKVEMDKHRGGRLVVEETNDLAEVLPAPLTSSVQSRKDNAGQALDFPEQPAQQSRLVEESQVDVAQASNTVEEHDIRRHPMQSGPGETEESQEGNAEKQTPTKMQKIDAPIQPTDFPVSDDAYMPVLDDDWDMPDAEAEAEGTSTPKATAPDEEAEKGETTPSATPQKRLLATSVSTAMQPPASSTAVIVDLGNDSTQEAKEDLEVTAVTHTSSADVSRERGIKASASSGDSMLDQEVVQTIEPTVKQEALHSPPPVSPPRTRRRTRQSTIETVSQPDTTRRRTRQSTIDAVSQTDTSTPTRSQRRSVRSSQNSRASLPSHGGSDVAARVAQRRRKIEVKNSEREWDSNASISTQRPSSPSAPSNVPAMQEFELSAGPQPSQILGELSQMERQDRENSPERPPVSPITPIAPSANAKSPVPTEQASEQASEEDQQEAQNRRLQKELEGSGSAQRSSSPFPELNFKWGSQKQNNGAEAEVQTRPEQSSMLHDDFERAGPTHSSILQDDSSVLRAMRTSRFPFGTQLAEQDTQTHYDESLRAMSADYPTQVVSEHASSPPQVETTSSLKHVEESQAPLVTASLREEAEETQFPSVKTGDSQEQGEVVSHSSHLTKAATTSKPVTSGPQALLESNALTPKASQDLSQGQPAETVNHMDNTLPPTPRETQTTSATPSFYQTESQVPESQMVKPSVEQRAESADEDSDMSDADMTSQLKPSQKFRASRDIKWTPSQLSQGTRTSYSYFTPLAHLTSYTNSQSLTVDVLAVCTAPNKAPIRANAGPRDYTTLFSITDTSLENGMEVRVQVFRPWKAALPECDVGDAVLLRGFSVKSRKGKSRLVSGSESAWCVFRYGAIQKLKTATASQPNSQEVTDAEGEDGDKGGKKGHAKSKSDIMDSMKPIWADIMSGLWGAVASQDEKPASEGEAEDNGYDAAVISKYHNVVSGATREEVHGPPVEFGDEERREARSLREWWVGVGGERGSGKEVKLERDGRNFDTHKSNGAASGKRSQEVKEEKTESLASKDFLRSFF